MRPNANVLIASFIVLLAVPYSLAQRQGGSGGGSTTPRPSAPTSTVPSPSRNIPNINNERGMVLITGRVVTEEGTAPAEIVSIERICGNSERREGYTDRSGYFSLQLGSTPPGILQDASVSSGTFGRMGMDPGPPGVGTMAADPGITQQELTSCDLRAALSGYQSTRVPLFSARLRSANNVGTIVIYRMDRSKAAIISVTALRAPKDAKKAYEKGMKLLQKNKVEDATKEFEKALSVYPEYAEAWFRMGTTHEMARRPEEARRHYNKAIELDSHFILPYIQLAYLAMQESNWQKVVELTDRALALNPFEYPAVHFFNAVGNYNLQNYEAAERSSKKTDLLDSREAFPKNHLLLGRLLTQKGDYQAAAKELKAYIEVQPKGEDLPQVKEELGRLESMIKDAPEETKR